MALKSQTPFKIAGLKSCWHYSLLEEEMLLKILLRPQRRKERILQFIEQLDFQGVLWFIMNTSAFPELQHFKDKKHDLPFVFQRAKKQITAGKFILSLWQTAAHRDKKSPQSVK